MNGIALDRTLGALALAGATVVVLLLLGALGFGISHDYFQTARPAADFAARVADPNAALGLRVNLGLDGLNVLVYASFLTLVASRMRDVLDARTRAVALGAILLSAVCDVIENQHIAAMLQMIEAGLPVTHAEGPAHTLLTGLKLQASYLALALFALGFWRLGGLGRLVGAVLWAYVLFGLVIIVTPAALVRPMTLSRTAFFEIAYLASAALFLRKATTAK